MAAGSEAARRPADGHHPPLVLSPVAAAASDARRYVRDVLLQCGLDHVVDVVSLAVSELVTNAVLHARTEIAVSLLVTPTRGPRLEVLDGSPVPPHLGDHGPTSSIGRGLRLLGALGRWGVEPPPDRDPGKIVWFEPATSVRGGGPLDGSTS